jgi:hypothetical protein
MNFLSWTRSTRKPRRNPSGNGKTRAIREICVPKIGFGSLPGLLACLLFLAACTSPQIGQGDITVSITADGATQPVKVPAGSTVQEALTAIGLKLGELDRLEPPSYTVLSDGAAIKMVRVREEFETQQLVIPYEHQDVRNESLSEGETRLIQSGQNGLKEITIRHLYEDGIQVSSATVKEITLQQPVPEIVMIGVQTPYAPLTIPGKLAYLAGGNAWLMEGSTANRRPLVTTGDLDERIFVLSPDRTWLLFTRKSAKPADQEINTLWVVSTTTETPKPVDTKISNVVHFAGWMPGEANTILYSTVEPRLAPPGWQANNDLYKATFYLAGGTTKPKKLIESNAGGIYGWWGTTYAWSPNSAKLAYARPDGIGFVDENGKLIPLLDVTPFNTHGDWAWIPGLAWGADSATLYVVTHAPSGGLASAEESPFFDLRAVSLVNSANVRLVEKAGMFAYPAVSPLLQSGTEKAYSVAYLEAIFPEQSEISRYRLVVVDRDGSNRRVLFPDKGLPGLEVQTPAWAPGPNPDDGNFLAVIYQGNLCLIDATTGQAQPVTGDGLMSKIDWK